LIHHCAWRPMRLERDQRRRNGGVAKREGKNLPRRRNDVCGAAVERFRIISHGEIVDPTASAKVSLGLCQKPRGRKIYPLTRKSFPGYKSSATSNRKEICDLMFRSSVLYIRTLSAWTQASERPATVCAERSMMVFGPDARHAHMFIRTGEL
jgi:hypothetical protein